MPSKTAQAMLLAATLWLPGCAVRDAVAMTDPTTGMGVVCAGDPYFPFDPNRLIEGYWSTDKLLMCEASCRAHGFTVATALDRRPAPDGTPIPLACL